MKSLTKKLLLALALVLSVTMYQGIDTQAASAAKAVSAKITGYTVKNGNTYYTIDGKTLKVKASVSPSKADKRVTYSSSKKSVATISSKGVIKAKKAGKTTITVKAKKGGKKFKMTVVVSKKASSKKLVKSITLTSQPSYLNVGGGFTLKYKFNPTSPTVKGVIFTSSNTSVATVSSSGRITARKAGTVKITVQSIDKNKKSDSVTFRVYAPVKSISFASSKTLVNGASASIKASTNPSATTDTISYSSNSSLVSVNAAGVIKANNTKIGSATITCKVTDARTKKVTFTKTCKVTVAQANETATFVLNQDKILERLNSGQISLTMRGTLSYTRGDKDLYTQVKSLLEKTQLNDTERVYPNHFTFQTGNGTTYVASFTCGALNNEFGITKDGKEMTADEFNKAFEDVTNQSGTITFAKDKVTKEFLSDWIANYNKVLVGISETFSVTLDATLESSIANVDGSISNVAVNNGIITFTANQKAETAPSACVASMDKDGKVTVTYNKLYHAYVSAILTSDRIGTYIKDVDFN